MRAEHRDRPTEHAVLRDCVPPDELDRLVEFARTHVVPPGRGEVVPIGRGARHALYLGEIASLDLAVARALEARFSCRTTLRELLAASCADPARASEAESRVRGVVVALMRDAPGYFIAPHTDARAGVKVLTAGVFVHSTDPGRCPGTAFHASRGSAGEEYPHVPNTGYAFVVSEGSWHSVRAVPEGCVRVTLIVFYTDTLDDPRAVPLSPP